MEENSSFHNDINEELSNGEIVGTTDNENHVSKTNSKEKIEMEIDHNDNVNESYPEENTEKK